MGVIANAASPKGIPLVTPPLPKAAPVISFEDLWTAHEEGKAVIVDARPTAEYRDGHIAGAISAPYDDRDKHLTALRKAAPPETLIIAYCDAAEECESSRKLSGWLLRQGWRNVRYFEEGFGAWRDAGLPVSEGDAP